MDEDTSTDKKLNIVVFPWLAFGHFIPFLELSQQLAQRNHHIYFLSTPLNLQRLPKIPPNLSSLITLVPLPMPHIEHLPPNAEATSDVGFEIGTDILKQAFDALALPLTKFLESSQIPFDWIIYDFACYWLPHIADNFGIKKVFFSIYFARTVSVSGSGNIQSTWDDLCKPPPWIPFPNSSIFLLPHEKQIFISNLRKVTSSGVSDSFRVMECIKGCDVIVIRTSMDIEGEYIRFVEEIEEKVVFPLLLPPCLDVGPGDESWKFISGWLDKQRRGSVVYVAFGSEFELSQDQLTELALGLELSELPFFWAFRKSRVSSLELPKGFEERTRDRGIVWTRWVSQLMILSHDSVGGLLTHCGWSSIIEALQFGKPLIMLPLAIDHGFYARFMVEKKVGIEIPKNMEDGSFTRNSVSESIRVVLQSEDGKIYKNEAEKLSLIFGDKELNGGYVNKFSDYLCEQRPNRVGMSSSKNQ